MRFITVQLTRFTDYSLRVLIELGSHPDALATVSGMATKHVISRHHLTHVVHQLGLKGYIETVSKLTAAICERRFILRHGASGLARSVSGKSAVTKLKSGASPVTRRFSGNSEIGDSEL